MKTKTYREQNKSMRRKKQPKNKKKIQNNDERSSAEKSGANAANTSGSSRSVINAMARRGGTNDTIAVVVVDVGATVGLVGATLAQARAVADTSTAATVVRADPPT
jgi:hypothetical protein